MEALLRLKEKVQRHIDYATEQQQASIRRNFAFDIYTAQLRSLKLVMEDVDQAIKEEAEELEKGKALAVSIGLIASE